MNADLLRFVDSISRDKSIEKESVFADLEAAMESAARKAFPDAEDVSIRLDRITGDIDATADDEPIDMKTLGRIAAQTAKQVMIQRIREDERNSIFDEYSERVGEVVTGTVTRYDGGVLVIGLGRAEAILPRSEQIPGESHHSGERVRAMILDVREEQNQVRIVLTQTHPDYIRRLFELEVPEVGERIIEIRALAREAGYRTKIAVSSIDSKVDAIGACVGVRGSRIRNIVDELGGEKVDIVRWNESSQVLITNALKPAEVKEVFLCFEMGRATVIVDEEQLSLAIGKRGQNVRLGARLTGWDIDIQTPVEYDRNLEYTDKALKTIEGVEDVLLDKLLAMGIISLSDLVHVGPDPLVKELELDEELAKRIVAVASEGAKAIEIETAARKAAEAEARTAAAEARARGEEAGVEATASFAEGEEAPGDSTEISDAGADDSAGAGESDSSPIDAAASLAEATEPVAEDAPGDSVEAGLEEASTESNLTESDSIVEADAVDSSESA